MNSDIQTFCTIIRNRSEENKLAIKLFSHEPYRVLSPIFSILRQEIDSMIRAIFLLQIDDMTERQRLVKATLAGEKWKISTPKGKFRDITDREMVELAQKLQGWSYSVYSFGCAFIHLSNFHNHHAQNPFQSLTESEKHDILKHMRYYHGGPHNDNPDMLEFSMYLPRVFHKISENLECYLEDLEENRLSHQTY